MPRGARTDTRADTAIAVLCVALSLILIILPESPRDRVAGVVRGNLVGPIVALQRRAALARRAFVTNDSLARTTDSIVSRSLRLDALEAENARLRGLLGLGRALRWGFIPAEALVGRGMGDEFTFVLSAGTRAGVERFSAVVGAEGLIGMVTQVDERTSIAITWPHPSFAVSATTIDGGAFGIVSAHQGSGAERYLLELRGAPFRAQVKPGTAVVSSGLGGVFPRGVLIGTVLEEIAGTSGWSKAYLIRPAVRPSEVTQVMVLIPERNGEGVGSVWTPASMRDSAARNAAADSIAREAIRQAAARAALAARDSMLRDTTRRDTTRRDTTRRDTTPRGSDRPETAGRTP